MTPDEIALRRQAATIQIGQQLLTLLDELTADSEVAEHALCFAISQRLAGGRSLKDVIAKALALTAGAIAGAMATIERREGEKR